MNLTAYGICRSALQNRLLAVGGHPSCYGNAQTNLRRQNPVPTKGWLL